MQYLKPLCESNFPYNLEHRHISYIAHAFLKAHQRSFARFMLVKDSMIIFLLGSSSKTIVKSGFLLGGRERQWFAKYFCMCEIEE